MEIIATLALIIAVIAGLLYFFRAGMHGDMASVGILTEMEKEDRAATFEARRALRRGARALTTEATTPVTLSFQLGPNASDILLLVNGIVGGPEWQALVPPYLATFAEVAMFDETEPPDDQIFADPVFRDMVLMPLAIR